jgi:GDP-4-dehydro-6-deoxy-D-mannose reductase
MLAPTAFARPSPIALVTGAAGFAGTALVREILRSTAWRVVGVVRRRRTPSDHGRYTEVLADVTDGAMLRRVISEIKPDYALHLAAATPPAADREYLVTNIHGVVALLEAVVAESRETRILIVGSDAQYGQLGNEYLPTPENAPMHPTGAYGRSKVLQEQIALTYQRMENLRVICVRPFNHIGPGQSARFFVGSVARQIARIEAGVDEGPVRLGDLTASRDFTDVRDVVRAYLLAAVLGEPGWCYNVGSGKARPLRTIAETLVSAARVPVDVVSEPSRARSTDVGVTQCDSSRLRESTGWAPAIPLEQTLMDILEYWRAVEPCTSSV